MLGGGGWRVNIFHLPGRIIHHGIPHQTSNYRIIINRREIRGMCGNVSFGYLITPTIILPDKFGNSKCIQRSRVWGYPHSKIHLREVGVNLPGVGQLGQSNTNAFPTRVKDIKLRVPQGNQPHLTYIKISFNKPEKVLRISIIRPSQKLTTSSQIYRQKMTCSIGWIVREEIILSHRRR